MLGGGVPRGSKRKAPALRLCDRNKKLYLETQGTWTGASLRDHFVYQSHNTLILTCVCEHQHGELHSESSRKKLIPRPEAVYSVRRWLPLVSSSSFSDLDQAEPE